MLIGYARVSKTDGSQSLDLQRDALRAAVRDDRPGLDSCPSGGRPPARVPSRGPGTATRSPSTR